MLDARGRWLWISNTSATTAGIGESATAIANAVIAVRVVDGRPSNATSSRWDVGWQLVIPVRPPTESD
jgi:hypothetical protein